MPEPLVVRRETYIAAPPATVFAFLTDPGKDPELDGRGGDDRAASGRPLSRQGLGGDGRARRAGRSARSCRSTASPTASVGTGSEEVPPGSSLVEIDLLDRDGGTLLRLTHNGLPDAAQCANHDIGWRHYMARLAIAATGGSAGVDIGAPVADM